MQVSQSFYSEFNAEDYPQTIRGYTLQRFLGRGTFGVVCLYQKGSEKVAIKLETTKTMNQSLTSEALFFKKMSKAATEVKAPKYYDHGLAKSEAKPELSYNFLIIQYFEESLEDIFQRQRENFGQLSEMALRALQSLHDIGHLHRDVKPDNFRYHNGEVYLIDFGM